MKTYVFGGWGWVAHRITTEPLGTEVAGLGEQKLKPLKVRGLGSNALSLKGCGLRD